LEAAIVDLADAAYWQDPHAVLRSARHRADVARTATNDWIVLGYDEVDRLARDPRVVSNAVPMLEQVGVTSGPLHAWWTRMLTNQNGESHAALRGLVSRAFTPRQVQRLRPRLRERVRSILRMHADRGELEVVRDLADPVPIWLMCELLGIGAEEHTTFAGWSTDLGDALASVMTPERRAKAEQALVGLDERIRKLLAERRAEPGDDLLTALVAEADALEAPVDETELVTLVINLIFGGHDTSRSLLTVAVALLLAYPEQLERLRREPKLVEAAGEEILRFEPPIAVLAREPTEPIETSGARLEAGKMFFLSVLAANRDPAVFADPDRFDIGRDPVRSFSFGWGSHFCLGTALARAELQELLSVLVSETSRLERIGDAPRWVPFVSIRRLESLPIRYSMKSRS